MVILFAPSFFSALSSFFTHLSPHICPLTSVLSHLSLGMTQMSVLGKDNDHNNTHQVSPSRDALARGNRYRNYRPGSAGAGVGVSTTVDEGLLYDGDERHSMASMSSFVVLAEADALLNEFRDSFMVASSEGGHHTGHHPSASQSQYSFAGLGDPDVLSRHKNTHHQQQHLDDENRQSTTNHYAPSSTKDDDTAEHRMLLSPKPPSSSSSSSDAPNPLNQSSSSQRRLIASLTGGIGTGSLLPGASTSQGAGAPGASLSPRVSAEGTEEQEVFSFLEKYSDKLVEMVSKKVEAKAAAAAAVLAASITSDNTSK